MCSSTVKALAYCNAINFLYKNDNMSMTFKKKVLQETKIYYTKIIFCIKQHAAHLIMPKNY